MQVHAPLAAKSAQIRRLSGMPMCVTKRKRRTRDAAAKVKRVGVCAERRTRARCDDDNRGRVEEAVGRSGSASYALAVAATVDTTLIGVSVLNSGEGRSLRTDVPAFVDRPVKDTCIYSVPATELPFRFV